MKDSSIKPRFVKTSARTSNLMRSVGDHESGPHKRAGASPASADRFDIKGELGSGPNGTVWRAFDRVRQTEVALKSFHHQLNAEQQSRIKEEFRALVDLRHPNIVRLYELLEIDDQLLITMELIQGADFLTWVWAHESDAIKPLDSERVEGDFALDETTKETDLLSICPTVDQTRLRDATTQLLVGITAIHASGAIHRNIKPSNVMVTTEGRVVIADLGFTNNLFRVDSEDTTARGSLAYQAPELGDGETVSEKADFYSLGVLLFEAFTGRTPFASTDLGRDIRITKATSDAPPPSAIAKDVPPDLDHLTSALLRRDATDRAGAADVQRVLEPNRKPRRSAMIEALTSMQDHVPAPRMPLVGRQAELAALSGALAGTKRNGATLQLILGPSGIGKTSLVEAFSRQLATDSIVLAARCHERETLPFKAFDGIIDALSRRLKQLPAQTRARVLPERADLLAELFPVLRRVEGVGGGARKWRGADPGELRLRAFAALRDLLAALARHAPMVIIIDDFHQADLDSLDLLAHLVRPPASPRCLFIAAGRKSAAVEHVLALAERGPFCEVKTLTLAPLPIEEAELLADIAASHFDLNLDNPRAIAVASTGHPGFAIELVRARSEALDEQHRRRVEQGVVDGEDQHDESTTIATDQDINKLLVGRLNRLTAAQQRILNVIAVLGTPVSLELIATASTFKVTDVAKEIEHLVDQDFVVASGLTPDAIVEVYHDRIREVVITSLDNPLRSQIHQLVAQALEGRDDADPERLMHHWRAAGQNRRAVDYAFAAARRASDALEFHRAVELYQQALAEQLPADVERATRIELAEVLGFVGRPIAAAEEFLAATRGALREQSIDLRRRAALAYFTAGDIENGAALMADVTANLGLPAERKIGLVSGLFGRKPARFTAQGAFFERREPDQIALNDIVTLDSLATASIEMGVIAPRRAFEAHTRFLELSCNVGDSVRYARALGAEAVWKASFDPLAHTRVAHLLATAAAAADIDGGPLCRAQLQLSRAITAFHLGDLAAANEAISQTITTLESDCRGALWETRTARMYAGWIYLQSGDLRAFISQSKLWHETAVSNGDSFGASMLSMGPGNFAWVLSGDIDGALLLLQNAETMWAKRPVPLHHFLIAMARVDLELFRNNTSAAATHLRWYEQLAGRHELDRLHYVATALAGARMRVAIALANDAQRTGTMKDVATALTMIRVERKHVRVASSTNRALDTLMNAALLSFSDTEAAVAEFRKAGIEYRQLGQYVHAAACRWRAAKLAGGAIGVAETMAAIDHVKQYGVADAEALLRFLAVANDS
jgi:eukaryotic-like serine/threonine-protein kinase